MQLYDIGDSAFLKRLTERILVFDGAMGTSIHAHDLPVSDYDNQENCSEILTRTRPDVIEEIHRSFLEVGCDCVETNTFGGSKLVLGEFGLTPETYDLNVASAQIARRAVEAYSTPEHPRFVVGSMGPGTKLPTLRQVDYQTLRESYAEQVRGLLDGGVDALLIETCQDLLQVKTAIQAVRDASDKTGRAVPLMVQVTMETTGTMLVGSDMAAAITTVAAFPEVAVLGLNCATGPREMSEHIRFLSHHWPKPISVQPNAGLPQVVDGQTHFPLTPDELARWLREFVVEDGVQIVGGCCGTTPEHLKAVVEAMRDLRPAARDAELEPSVSSMYQAVSHRQENSFLIVGERCNTNGSRKFKRLLEEGDVDGMVEVGIEQVKEEGAHVLDVCVDYVGRDGAPDMDQVVCRFAREITVPLMLDSTQPDVLEAGLRLAGGKCIINSVNLEDGEEKLDLICGLARQYGAALVALTIDEDPEEAMAKTADRKLEIAKRLRDLITGRHGVPESDIFFDCLTFPITTGNPDDRRLGLETLDGIERIMTKLPKCQAILGLSNISFGLQPAARVVLNSVFLHEARERGLTAAIVHAGKILPDTSISEERWNAALDLIYDRGEDALERYIALFSEGEQIGEKQSIESLPVEERLTKRIIDGARNGLDADLDEAMKQYEPLHIINKFLLDGMKVVGELFGAGKMQLPFVLKSAETMKRAVAHLEPHMEKVEGQSRGKMILATVRGDVHDIGKNLVDIIVSNNGFEVINLGIKQPINNVIAAFEEHKAHAIGLSGLLVKSTVIMRDDLAVLNEQGIDAPVILGGAALTRRYVEEDLRKVYNGRVYYAKDAFDGLRYVTDLCEGDLLEQPYERPAAAPAAETEPAAGETATKPAAAHVEPERIESPERAARRGQQQLTEEWEQRIGLREVADDDASESTDPAPAAAPALAEATSVQTVERSSIAHEALVPQPPFWGPRVMEKIELRAALGYINETMLFQVQWGYRKKGRTPDEYRKYLNTEVRPHYRDLVARCEAEKILNPQAIYGFWPCGSDGDDLVIFAPPELAGAAPESHGDEIARFHFPRQRKSPHWCLSDFWRPADGEVTDVIGFQVATAGQRVSDIAREWFSANEYQQYLYLHGLGVEVAEALAEYIHKQVRLDLGIAGDDARDLQALFKQGYRGSRYSFGYPACPNLEDQARLVELLGAERIGVTLSDEFQLHPEQSTSAVVAHHPEARYFNVR